MKKRMVAVLYFSSVSSVNAVQDVDTFISDTLKGENLSKRAKEKKDALIKKIKDIKSNFPQEFPERGELEDKEDDESTDNPSLASDRYDKEDEGPSDGKQFTVSQGCSGPAGPVFCELNCCMSWEKGKQETVRRHVEPCFLPSQAWYRTEELSLVVKNAE
ncbi:src kinase-associated phosphoprotein 2-like isoform X2 [Varanus komodoensis]|uniref:src kinase-associated phosphoprotein 2-like isoform X2 n=1 Tax=Varanus komodoensis TaxID=61221 RepID=UPI001CF78042|nr:src kinase-associated phosphoprotein 2-like isoform X2 [Varanus komodoensis]XP_044294459.1 src kinase-associated phosphoprotein 2-like isoform X2 [Varanus komodoensis]